MIRVLIVDDHRMVRQGLRFLLEQEPEIEVVGECVDGSGVLDAVRALEPHVILLDLLMPRVDGLAVLSALRRRIGEHAVGEGYRPEVVVLTSVSDDEQVVAALHAGALSYLPKTAGVEQVVNAVRAAAHGESTLEPGTATLLVRRLREADRHNPLAALSARERQVLTELARGRSNRQISRSLSIGEETVKTHVSSVVAKLGLSNRTQAAILGLQQGLVPLAEALDD